MQFVEDKVTNNLGYVEKPYDNAVKILQCHQSNALDLQMHLGLMDMRTISDQDKAFDIASQVLIIARLSEGMKQHGLDIPLTARDIDYTVKEIELERALSRELEIQERLCGQVGIKNATIVNLTRMYELELISFSYFHNAGNPNPEMNERYQTAKDKLAMIQGINDNYKKFLENSEDFNFDLANENE